MGDGHGTSPSGEETSTPGDPSKSEQDKKARIRDNQRRSRARRQEHLLDLERRLAECHSTCREAELQREAFMYIQAENARLRDLLRAAGFNEALTNSYVNQGIAQSAEASTSLRQIRPRIALRDVASSSEQDSIFTHSDISSFRGMQGTDEVAIARMPQVPYTHAQNVPALHDMQLPRSLPARRTTQPQHSIFQGSTQLDNVFCCDTFRIPPAGPLLEDSENTILCSVAKDIIQQYTVDPIDMEWIKTRLATGFCKPALLGQGCRVSNQVLFQVHVARTKVQNNILTKSRNMTPRTLAVQNC